MWSRSQTATRWRQYRRALGRNRQAAAGIPGVRFVTPGKNHVLLEQELDLPRFLEELANFMNDLS
jgi:hypothetical protein